VRCHQLVGAVAGQAHSFRSAETPERTRVELEHRNLERHGDSWKGVREAVAGDGGWPLYLRRYVEVLAKRG
jgi:hypothetical protein